jgi:prephenate dehydrogenase
MEGRTAAIIGLGLIGGSLAFRLRNRGYRVIGYDLSDERTQTALHLGAVNESCSSAAAAVKDCDFVFVATPVGAIPSIIEEIMPHTAPEAIVTDVGSVKRPIMEKITALQPLFTFIGGHPMAGSEQGGIEAADPNLFENAVYVLTPISEDAVGEQPFRQLAQLIESDLGAAVMVMQPKVHDEVVAAVSHLPHIAAAALVHALGRTAEKIPAALALAAGGFRDTTRIASGLPDLWADICLHNRASVLRTIAFMQDALESVQEALLSQDGAGLKEFFAFARALRAEVPAAQKGLLPPLFDVMVPVPDMSGAISAVTSLLASADLNVKDISIVRQREGEVGALRIGLADGLSSDRALEILQAGGYKAYRR